MSCRPAIPVLVPVLLVLGVSCANPPSFRKAKYDPVPGIERGDTAERVQEVLKTGPARRENGYWLDSNRFEMDFQVWHFKGVGRVIFHRSDMTVYATEADPVGG
jgi:hypothetical protein